MPCPDSPQPLRLRVVHPNDPFLTELRTIAAQCEAYAPQVYEHHPATAEAMERTSLLLDQLVMRLIIAEG
jgi:hypothetical protein